jgi:hypothetical protein
MGKAKRKPGTIARRGRGREGLARLGYLREYASVLANARRVGNDGDGELAELVAKGEAVARASVKGFIGFGLE